MYARRAYLGKGIRVAYCVTNSVAVRPPVFSVMPRFCIAALASVLACALACRAAVLVPPELVRLTGLSEVELIHLLEPRDTTASCPSSANFTGVFSGPAQPSPADIIRRNSFVKRVGTGLKLAGESFKPVGANIYWLGLDENVVSVSSTQA